MGEQEFAVVVQQTPGTVSWNFDQLKTELQKEMDTYKSLVYTEESLTDARSDLAKLRKLKTAVNDRKKLVKTEFEKPYTAFEAQVKELIKLIEEPIALIDGQVKEFEAKQKEARKAEIVKAMKEAFADLPEDIAARLRFNTYDNRWENASAVKKTWKEAIAKAHNDTVAALSLIDNVDPDFKETVMNVYKQELNITDALKKAQEMQKQKEQLEETQRRRAEEVEARRRALEAVKTEEAAKANNNAPEQVKTEPAVTEHPQSQPDPVRPQQAPAQTEETPVSALPTVHTLTVSFTGEDESLRKILGYAKFLGLSYKIGG